MRAGIDLGGTKTEILLLDDAGAEHWRQRIATPKTYAELIASIATLVAEADSRGGGRVTVGMAIPGSESFGSGLIKNANTVFLNGKPLRIDLEAALGREVRLLNDANCFVLSEANDGAAAGAAVAFGVIAGTGLGGGMYVGGKVLVGAHGVAGEWGHIPLPMMTQDEHSDGRGCYCGKRDCLETWCCGPAVEKEHLRRTGRAMTMAEIAASNDAAERETMARFTDRLARGLAVVVNILDPDVIVLGGGLSNIGALYRDLPPLVERYAFNLGGRPRIVKNRHGDSSGVRGAAWLWPEQPAK
jgi:fructokinase